jgi:hypothetical protein
MLARGSSSYVTTLHSPRNNNGVTSKGLHELCISSQPETPGQSALPETVMEVDGVARVFRSSGLHGMTLST